MKQNNLLNIIKTQNMTGRVVSNHTTTLLYNFTILFVITHFA